VLAFAHAEQGDRDESLVAFLHGIIQQPRTAHMLLALDTDRPEETDEILDHNAGVDVLLRLGAYFEQMSPEVEDWFTSILEAPLVRAMIDEYLEVRRKWRATLPTFAAVYIRSTTSDSRGLRPGSS